MLTHTGERPFKVQATDPWVKSHHWLNVSLVTLLLAININRQTYSIKSKPNELSLILNDSPLRDVAKISNKQTFVDHRQTIWLTLKRKS